MKEYELEQVVHLSRMLPNESAYTVGLIYKRLRHYAARLSTIDVHYCNGTRYANDDGESLERARNAVYVCLDELQKEYGIWYYHQTDPRGASLYVDVTPREHYTEAMAITTA